ncbi:restriction endonuclease subunit S [Paraclostridium sordellii]|uniref:restriction endonuclease subunit S n=1 Tax=Paraclostridium sordellii TaxID=1505 RepID=UPI0013DFF561|nr:restriction endonuclease subunit S [Paeniclostridium sordellii]
MKVDIIKFKEISYDIKLPLKGSDKNKNGVEINKILKHSVNVSIKSGRTPSKTEGKYWDNGIYEFLNMKDVDNDLFILKDQCTEKITRTAIKENSNLLKVPKGSLVISNAMTIGLAFILQRDVYVNQNVFWIDIDESKYNKKFLMWYFNVVLREYFANKYEAKYLSKDELGRVIVPNISINKQKEIISIIEKNEISLKELKEQVIEESEIIDSVLSEVVNIDMNRLNELKSKNIFKMNFHECSIENYDMRIGHRYSNRAFKYLKDELNKNIHGNIKEYLKEPMSLGASIRPDDYIEKGNKYYISMASIKNWNVDLKNSKIVSDEFYYKNISKSLKKGDIVVARSGEGTIGKVGYIEQELDAIFSDFTIRIRVDNNKLDSKFMYYYMRSKYMQLLIEFNKKGLGNNTNIFPNEIKNFSLIHLDLLKQKEIVKDIENKINKVEDIKNQMKCIKETIENEILSIL